MEHEHEDESTPSQLEQLIVCSKNLGTALAVNYVYNYLYNFLRKKHTVTDHLEPSHTSEVQDDNEECHCGCVLNGYIDRFLKELDVKTPNKSGRNWQEIIPSGSPNRKFVLLCDPAASRERDKQVYDSKVSVKFWFRLSTFTPHDKIKFRAFDRDYLIPVHVVGNGQSLVFSGLASVDSILYDLFDVSSFSSQVTSSLVTINKLRPNFYYQFIATLRQLVANDDQLNELFFQLIDFQLIDLPDSEEFKDEDIQKVLNEIANKMENPPNNDVSYYEEDIELDKHSIINAKLFEYFYGFVNLIIKQDEFKCKVKKCYLIFPSSAKVNAITSAYNNNNNDNNQSPKFQRDKTNDVVLNIARCGDNTRPYFIHAWKYYDGTTERQVYLDTPSALAMFEHMQDVVAEKPNARIQSPKCRNIIKEALSGLGPEESLSWKLADALQNFMNIVPGFNAQDFPVIKWDDIKGDELILPQ